MIGSGGVIELYNAQPALQYRRFYFGLAILIALLGLGFGGWLLRHEQWIWGINIAGIGLYAAVELWRHVRRLVWAIAYDPAADRLYFRTLSPLGRGLESYTPEQIKYAEFHLGNLYDPSLKPKAWPWFDLTVEGRKKRLYLDRRGQFAAPELINATMGRKLLP